MSHTRREVLSGMGVVGLAAISDLATGSTAKSYAQILGANDRLNFALIGLNGRGDAHLSALKANQSTARVSHVCDVESNILKKFADTAQRELGYAPAAEKDFRKILEQKTWMRSRLPLPITGMRRWRLQIQAGKHVYVEKPCSHNPAEGALLVEAQRSTESWCRWGTSSALRRTPSKSSSKIHEGLIGRPYYAKCWYSQHPPDPLASAKRFPCRPLSTGTFGKARRPEMPYRDNVHPYNWHWFRNWGTGETLNNGTHEVDVCRWALGVDYPNRVSCFRRKIPVSRRLAVLRHAHYKL